MIMRRSLWAALACTLCLVSSPAPADKPVSSGVYVDRDRGRHPWQVNQAHTLIWDGEPYLPVGGMYSPPYMSEPTESGWALTRAQFDLLKQKGVIDLYIHVAMSSPPESLQRIIDYLERNGFRYGIELSDGLGHGPGYVVQKDGLKVEHITRSGTYGVEVRDPLGGVSLLVDESDGSVVKVGKARVYNREKQTGRTLADGRPEMATETGLEIDVECPPGKSFCACFTPLVNGGKPYFWDGGFEAYRDKLLNYFGKIRFGKGFRFVVDPLHNEMNVSHTFVPSSPAWARQFSRWLALRYKNDEELNKAWAVQGDRVPGIEVAARLIPLRVLRPSRSEIGILYDPRDGKIYRVDVSVSQAWYDMMDFAADAYARYCNDICRGFKTKVADVPIVFRHSGPMARYRINMEQSGFDGIGMEPRGVGETAVQMNAAVCYSEAEQSAKTMWLLVTGFSQAASESQLASIAHVDRESMYADFATLLGIGAKGIFVSCLSSGPSPDGQPWMTEYIRDPRQLEWMATFRRIMESSGKLPDYRPTYYYRFPAQRAEKSVFGPKQTDYAGLDGDWTGCGGGTGRAVMRGPDGTWVLPTWDCSVDTPLIIANLTGPPASLRYGSQLSKLIREGQTLVAYTGLRTDLGTIPELDRYFTKEIAADEEGRRFQVLRPTSTCKVLGETGDGKVWNLVDGKLQIISRDVKDLEGWQPDGLRIPRVEQTHEPERFLAEVLGVFDFRIEPGIRGFAFQEDRKPVAYLWCEGMASSIRLSPDSLKGVEIRYSNGERAGEKAKDGSVTVRIPLKKQPETVTADAPFVRGQHRATDNWIEAVVLEGIRLDELKSLGEMKPANAPSESTVDIRIEAENFLDSNFNLGKYSGMTKLSANAFWGLDSFVDPPASTGYYVKYVFSAPRAGTYDLWVREWTGKSGCHWRVNGGRWTPAPERLEDFDRQFCGPWSLFDDDAIVFAWRNYGKVSLRQGENSLDIWVSAKRRKGDKYCKFLDVIAFTSDGRKPWEAAEREL